MQIRSRLNDHHSWSRVLRGEVSRHEGGYRQGSTSRVGTIAPIGLGQVLCAMSHVLCATRNPPPPTHPRL